jgi:PleD family two-component response regulator
MVMSHPWSHVAPGLAVTLCAGVAARNPEEPAKDWFDRADQALYAAKRAGRNRVLRAGDPALGNGR